MTTAVADAHDILTLNSPDGDRQLPHMTSPVKVLAKPGFVPLSPGPEKAKLHMDAVASLLGLSSAEALQHASLQMQTHHNHAPAAAPEPPLDEWTALSSSRPGATFRAAKRLTPTEIYSRTVTLPRAIFESLFGAQTSVTTTNALVEPPSGALLALAAEATSPLASFSLRAGPLINALRASAGAVLVLTALDAEDAAAGAPPRARAALGYPTDVAVIAQNIDNLDNTNTNTTTHTAAAVVNGVGGGHFGRESRSGSGSPGSLDSLTQLSDGDGSDGEGDPGAASNGGGGGGGGSRFSDGGVDGMGMDAADPDWQHGSGGGGGGGGSGQGDAPRSRGRPRKRKPFGGVGGSGTQRSNAAAMNLQCTHCGTRETPRWWKDAFPLGTLCNACGIWLKRHGYPRPVQFFSVPSAASPGAGMAPGAHQHHHHHPGSVGVGVGGVHGHLHGPAPGDFYLINGRPKRRRAAMNSTYGGRNGGGGVGGGDDDGSAVMAAAMVAAAAAAANGGGGGGGGMDAAINYEAAGGRVFVMRRKLMFESDPSGGGGVSGANASTASGSSNVAMAALVHFGWAPGTRAAHEMFDKVVGYGTASNAVTVEDFELLGDTKATATLTLRPDAETPDDWDALVRHFVDSL